jgi:uroporphyrinogen-III synthase
VSAGPGAQAPWGMNSPSALTGRRVVNTRSPDQAGQLDELLIARRAIPLSYPCIDIALPEDAGDLRQAVRGLLAGRFDWVVFTSANAVRAVAEAAKPGRIPPRARVAAVGPGTARTVRSLLGVEVDLEPAIHTGEQLGRDLIVRNPGTVFLPLGDLAGDELSATLRESGAEITAVTAYRTVVGSGGVDLPELLRERQVDAVLFTSPSTVDNLALRLEHENGDWEGLAGLCIGCIGPVTSRAAVARGLRVRVQPRDHTLVGLVDELERFFEGEGS